MPKNIIHICGEQKIIFIKKIMLITQQMMAECNSDQMDNFGVLLKERADYMRRIEKCDALLQKQETEENTYDETSYLSDQKAFQSILQSVLELNEQIEERLDDKRKELLEAGVNLNPQQSVLHI